MHHPGKRTDTDPGENRLGKIAAEKLAANCGNGSKAVPHTGDEIVGFDLQNSPPSVELRVLLGKLPRAGGSGQVKFH